MEWDENGMRMEMGIVCGWGMGMGDEDGGCGWGMEIADADGEQGRGRQNKIKH